MMPYPKNININKNKLLEMCLCCGNRILRYLFPVTALGESDGARISAFYLSEPQKNAHTNVEIQQTQTPPHITHSPHVIFSYS